MTILRVVRNNKKYEKVTKILRQIEKLVFQLLYLSNNNVNFSISLHEQMRCSIPF